VNFTPSCRIGSDRIGSDRLRSLQIDPRPSLGVRVLLTLGSQRLKSMSLIPPLTNAFNARFPVNSAPEAVASATEMIFKYYSRVWSLATTRLYTLHNLVSIYYATDFCLIFLTDWCISVVSLPLLNFIITQLLCYVFVVQVIVACLLLMLFTNISMSCSGGVLVCNLFFCTFYLFFLFVFFVSALVANK